FTRRNLIVASGNSRAIGGRVGGKRKTCHVSCAESLGLSYKGSARFRDWRRRNPLRRRGRRRYVLFDQVPKGCREQERDQLRAPVFQNQSLHICCATKSPKFVGGRFLE